MAYDYPAVLVIHEKHSNYYVHLDSEATLHKASLALLATRVKAKWYTLPERPKAPGYTLAMIDDMPASLQAAARLVFKEYEREAKYYASESQELTDIKKAIKDGDGKTAWMILLNRRGSEYERVEVCRYEPAEGI
jgi:hypothetical protein